MAAAATATATDADVNQQPHPTVAESAASCLHSFQQCVQRAASIHPRELSLVEDQLARFSVWTTNIRVFAPGRAALDHRLREAPDIQDAVIGLLDALAFRVQSCWNNLEPLSSGVAQESSQPLIEVDPKFRKSIQEIANEISLLHRFSNTIRRASKAAQNLKAEDSFRIRDDEGNDAEDFITKLFVNHIRDNFPGVGDNICQRLAETMVLRRKRILYRRSRYGDTPIRLQETPSQPQVTVPKVQLKIRGAEQPQASEGPQAARGASKSAIQSVAQSATTLAPGNFQKASAPSVVSVSKTVALSNHEELIFPPAPLGSLKRKYNEIRRQRDEIDKPNLDSPNSGDKLKSLNSRWKEKTKELEEIIKAVGEVTCPFCFYALPAEDVIDDNKWRLHVKNDLDAYVCLFEDCSLPHELYVHSSAWLKHMREHAMRWRCTSKSHGHLFVCESRDDYLTHMKTMHKGKFSDAQLQALADRNGRVIGPLFRSCPLCGKEEVDSTMDNHIVGHLRFLALKSLPTYEEEGLEDEGSQKGGSSASRAQSRRSTVESELERRSLGTLEDIGEVNGESWRSFLWGAPKLRSKYAPYGGFHSYISEYHTLYAEEDSISKASPDDNASPTRFLPPPDDEKLLSNHSADPSLEFVEGSLFDGVPDTERLEFEWGFIPNQHGAFGSLKDDPILQKFLVKYDHRTIGESFSGPNILPMNPSDTPNETKGLPASAFSGFTFPPTYTGPPEFHHFSSSPITADPDNLTSYLDFPSNDDGPWFPLFPQDDTIANQDNATSNDHRNPRTVKYVKSFTPEDVVYKDIAEWERIAFSELNVVIDQDSITPQQAVDDPDGQHRWPSPPPPIRKPFNRESTSWVEEPKPDVNDAKGKTETKNKSEISIILSKLLDSSRSKTKLNDKEGNVHKVYSRIKDHTGKSKGIPQTTSNENESNTINNEIIRISNRLSNVTWDVIDMENLMLDATISESLRVHGKYIPIKFTIHIPRGYPETSSLQLYIKKTPGMTDEICEYLDKRIHNLRNSLDAVFTFLSSGIDVGTNIREDSNEDQQEKDNKALQTPVSFTASREKTPGSNYDKLGNIGGTYSQEHKPRKSIIRMDPDCAICHAPASLACDCEAKALEIAVKQAESRIMSPMYNDIRYWVRSHAQDCVQESFSRNMHERQKTAAKKYNEQGSTREVVEGHTPPIKEQVNSSWSSAVQSFPETLEYFYSLVEVTLPSDDDPAVKDPPLSALSGSRKPSRRTHLQSPLELTEAETSKQGEAKKPEQEAKAYLPAQLERHQTYNPNPNLKFEERPTPST